MRIHYLQHVPFENPGSILIWAKINGYPVTCTRLYENTNLPEENAFDWLIIMGGPMNIYEEEKYPWLALEKAFIKKAVESGKLMIGLCLGAQLIADVIGGRVVQNKEKEIGWFPVTLTKEARALPVFMHLPEAPVVFEWHGDTFIDLPEGTTLLAYNDVCTNQAFVYGTRIFGFQFHLENTKEIIRALVENCKEEMVTAPFIQKEEEILAGTDYMTQDNKWMTLFLAELAAISDGST